MDNAEVAEIVSSLQDGVRRAYDLGRRDAIDNLVNVLKSDELRPKPTLALPSPKPGGVEFREPAPARMTADEPASAPLPWYMRR
jgi:hypothetical protein